MKNKKEAIKVIKLKKSYKSKEILKGINFKVNYGEALGLLGKNGSGKSTILETIEGLKENYEGKILLNKKDIKNNIKELKEILGIHLQTTSFHNKIKVKELFNLFASHYQQTTNINKLIKSLNLKEKENHYIKTLSEGQKKLVSLGLAFINNPTIIFLDEPTANIDIKTKKIIWKIIKKLKRNQKAILLSTHDVQEAEVLCNKIAILNQGKIIKTYNIKDLKKKNIKKIEIKLKNKEELKNHLKNNIEIKSIKIIKEKLIIITKNHLKTLKKLYTLEKNLKFKDITIINQKSNLENLFLKAIKKV